MTWIHPLAAHTGATADEIGGKAAGLVTLLRLGLPVPPGFVIATAACRAFLRDGRVPDGFDAELAAAVAGLEAATGRRLGGRERPLVVAVRSGAAVAMPGMMDTILNLGLPAGATSQDGVARQLALAVQAVFASWDAPRAATYRALHGVPDDLGTAVVVQAMVFGNRDEHSGSGVAFSRDPTTGEPAPWGEVLFGHQGDVVVGGGARTLPLGALEEREPLVWAALLDALARIEAHHRDAISVEFTFEAGRLWLLQSRAGGLRDHAAVRVAVDLADAGVITRAEALGRVADRDLRRALAPRAGAGEVLARGLGACPGVAAGRVATTADAAVRLAATGPVVLVRPVTSPLDLHGIAAAAGLVTERGGPASHAAIVARSMGRPAVVGVGELQVTEGTVITVDGATGTVLRGAVPVLPAAPDPHVERLLAWKR